MGPVHYLYIVKAFQNLFSINAKANLKRNNAKLVLICLYLFTGSNCYAQEVAPLKVDNIWVYDFGSGIFGRTSIIDSNVVIDSIQYFQTGDSFPRYMRLREDGYYAVRLDTSYPAPNHEKLYYKKNAVLGDTWINPGEDFPMLYSIVDTQRVSIFGQMVTVKRMDIDASLLYFIEFWTEEFGILSRSQHPFPWNLHTLTGCVIDGVVYGDTSFPVGVNDEIEPANDFTLAQNYPNPFNPTTKIKYSLPETGYVTLKIYDLLGNEIATLVNEEKPSGTFEVEFDGDGLASGIYIYRLTSGQFSSSKKLILLK